MDVPEVKYARRDGRGVAYQTFGAGSVVCLGISEWPANADSVWEHPSHLRMWRLHASIARVIRFDRSGIGSSDARQGVPDVEGWVDDALTVLDDVGAERVVVFGEGWGAHAAIALAASHSDRVERLMLFNSYARMLQAADLPEGMPSDVVDASVAFVHDNWGTGRVIGTSAPTLARGYQDFCARYERAAATPNTAAAMVRAAYESDVRGLLPRIQCPSLVIYSGDYTHTRRTQSLFLHNQIPGAELLEAAAEQYNDMGTEGSRRYIEFLANADNFSMFGSRELAVVVMSDIVGSTEQLARRGDSNWKLVLEAVDDSVHRETARYGGHVVKQTGDGHLLRFASPGSAIAAVLGVHRAAHALGIRLRSGIHMGEIEVRDDGDIAGMAVHLVARIATRASADEILVSRIVRDLADGTGLELADAGTHELKGIPSPVSLYSISANAEA